MARSGPERKLWLKPETAGHMAACEPGKWREYDETGIS